MFTAIALSISDHPVSWMVIVYSPLGYDTLLQKHPDRLGSPPCPVLDGVSLTIAARAKRSEREAHLSSSSTLSSDVKNEMEL